MNGVEDEAVRAELGTDHGVCAEAERAVGDDVQVAVPQVPHVGHKRAVRAICQHLAQIGLLLHGGCVSCTTLGAQIGGAQGERQEECGASAMP